ncbi:MAG: GAF domain-containing protein [Fidelibacterota bacterium]
METPHKKAVYGEVIRSLDALLSGNEENERLDEIAKMALVNTIVKRAFPHLLFVGFYRVVEPGLLQIGPYQGDVIACATIPFERGVCGACASSGKTVIVPEVLRFPGYIACDTRTRSEIVVPVQQNGSVIAVFDLDSLEPDGFDQTDQTYLELIVETFFS